MAGWIGVVCPSVIVLGMPGCLLGSDGTPAALNGDHCRERMFFAVWTVSSAGPLDCGHPGLDVTRWKSQEAANVAKSSEANWGPLSLTTTFGMPWRAKWLDSFL